MHQRRTLARHVVDVVLLVVLHDFNGVCPLQNTVLLEHQYFHLSCEANFNATCNWKYLDQRINNKDIIAPKFSAFKISTNVSQCDLITSKARLTHNGSYECEIFSNTVHIRAAYSAHVIVLGSDPVCSVRTKFPDALIEGDLIELECSLNYSGNWPPTMEWEFGEGSRIQHGVKNIHFHGQNMTSVLVRNLSHTDHGSVFRCRTYFNMLNFSSTNAANIPAYTNVYSSTLMNILFKPRNLTVLPAKGVLHPGDVVSCSAISNPIPSYQWINSDSEEIHTGQYLLISESMVREEYYKYTCSVDINITGRSVHWLENHTIQFVVIESKNPHILLIIGLVIAMTTSIVVTLLLCKKCLREKGANIESINEYTEPARDSSVSLSNHAYDDIVEPSNPTEINEDLPYVNLPRPLDSTAVYNQPNPCTREYSSLAI